MTPPIMIAAAPSVPDRRAKSSGLAGEGGAAPIPGVKYPAAPPLTIMADARKSPTLGGIAMAIPDCRRHEGAKGHAGTGRPGPAPGRRLRPCRGRLRPPPANPPGGGSRAQAGKVSAGGFLLMDKKMRQLEARQRRQGGLRAGQALELARLRGLLT